MMHGISINGLCELISHNHEAEFEYNSTTFVLQPEVNDDKTYLVIWDCTPTISFKKPPAAVPALTRKDSKKTPHGSV